MKTKYERLGQLVLPLRCPKKIPKITPEQEIFATTYYEYPGNFTTNLKDSKKMQELENSLSSWDEMVSLNNFKTYYLRYKGGDGYESLKRISINRSNTKTADITIPNADFPSYFFLRECKTETTKEPIQVDFSNDPNKKIS